MADDPDEVRGTPAFTTGGGGFGFEDRAGTWALSAMMAGQAPIGSLGVPSVIEFQQKVPPTALDDMVITGAGDTLLPRWFGSIKAFDLLGTPTPGSVHISSGGGKIRRRSHVRWIRSLNRPAGSARGAKVGYRN
jgi:hypothetical protein